MIHNSPFLIQKFIILNTRFLILNAIIILSHDNHHCHTKFIITNTTFIIVSLMQCRDIVMGPFTLVNRRRAEDSSGNINISENRPCVCIQLLILNKKFIIFNAKFIILNTNRYPCKCEVCHAAYSSFLAWKSIIFSMMIHCYWNHLQPSSSAIGSKVSACDAWTFAFNSSV